MRSRTLLLVAPLALCVGCVVFSGAGPSSASPTPTNTGTATGTPSGTPSPTPSPSPFTNVVYVTAGNDAPGVALPIVVNDSSGAIVRSYTTGSDGKVNALVPSNGSVTLFWTRHTSGQPDDYYAYEVVSPPSGVQIRWYVDPPSAGTPTPTPTPAANLFVTFSSIPPNTASIMWSANCHSFTSAPVSPVSESGVTACDRYPTGTQASWNVFAQALATDGAQLGWGLTTGAPNSFGANASITVDLSHTDFDPANVGHADLPYTATMSAGIYGSVNQDLYVQPWSIGNAGSSAAAQSVTMPVPHGILTTWSEGVYLQMQPSASEWLDMQAAWIVSSAGLSIGRVLDPSMFPTLSSGSLDGSDPSRPVVSWSAAQVPPTVDSQRIIAYLTNTDGQNIGHGVVWDVARPPDAPPSFRFPVVRSDLQQYAPQAGTTGWFLEIGFNDDESMNGYADTFSPASSSRDARTLYYEFR